MLRGVATLMVVAILTVFGPASMLHVHDYEGHDHVEHHHGPATHAHERAAHHENQSEPSGRLPAGPRLESCEPGDHAVTVAFTCVSALTSYQPSLVTHVVTVLVTDLGDTLYVMPSDVRAHSPPGLTDAPLRAPPVVHPA